MSSKKIFWTPIGLESLKESQAFVLKHWNQKVLEHFLNLIDKRVEQLMLNPELAPIINSTEYRKLVVHKNISIFYIIDSNIIKILLVWDNRQDPIALRNKLTNGGKH